MDKLAFLKSIFGDGKYFHNSKEFLVYCPFCDHKNPRFSINTETDAFKCWVCLKAGIGLFYPLKIAKASSAQIQQYESAYKAQTVKQKKTKEGINYVPQLPSEYQPLIHNQDKISYKKYRKYLENRGLSEEQILHYKIGVCLEGEFKGRIIFPSFNKGRRA